MRHTLAAAMLLTSTIATAQSLTPLNADMQCGQQMYRTPSEITVSLRNASSKAVTITNVDPGCGCISVAYDHGMIQPGQQTHIKLTLDNKQLGHFSRVISVSDSESDESAYIMLSGNVVTKVINYSGTFPEKLGDLLADVDNIEYDDVNEGQRLTAQINIMNPTGQNVEPTALRLPSYLRVSMQPRILAPRQSGVMYVTLNSKGMRDYGLNQTSFYLGKTPADKVDVSKEITVSTVLLPPAVAADSPLRANAPKMQLSEEEVDMTELASKRKVKRIINITNTGAGVLDIEKLQVFTTGLQVELGKRQLKPGETTKLKITADGKQLRNMRRHPRILMITNDPDNQKQVIYIKK